MVRLNCIPPHDLAQLLPNLPRRRYSCNRRRSNLPLPWRNRVVVAGVVGAEDGGGKGGVVEAAAG